MIGADDVLKNDNLEESTDVDLRRIADVEAGALGRKATDCRSVHPAIDKKSDMAAPLSNFIVGLWLYNFCIVLDGSSFASWYDRLNVYGMNIQIQDGMQYLFTAVLKLREKLMKVLCVFF